MYATEVDNQKLTFHVSGMLWNRSLIMRDLETGSLWSHILGRCVKGKLHKTELEILPSVITDWKTWKINHPETDVMVLSRTFHVFKKDFYKDKTIFGVGMVKDDKSKIWSFDGLSKTPLRNETFHGSKFVLWFDEETGGAWAWDRNVGNDLLDFEMKDGKIVDKKSGSTWNLMLGHATEGAMKGKLLKNVIVIPTFQQAWRKFHPDTEIWPKDDKYDPANDIGNKGGLIPD